VRDLQTDLEVREGIVQGGYWHVAPTPLTEQVVVFAGAVAPEALAAQAQLGANTALLQVTSYDKLAHGWAKYNGASYVASLLSSVPRDALLVTVLDGHPITLSWLGSVRGHRVRPLGVQEFGQTGDLIDLYHHYGIDAEAIVKACESAKLSKEIEDNSAPSSPSPSLPEANGHQHQALP
jgi:pyruvate dehydrogenase E1 component